jgi:hypothetical protein
MLKNELDKEKDLQRHLYEKGFLITNANIDNSADYPFYGNWNCTRIGTFNFWINDETHLYTYKNAENEFFLIGHAYNPYTMEYRENEILRIISTKYNTSGYFEAVDEITGIFILGVVTKKGIEFLLDASGMQYGCYGVVRGKLYITSHMRLVGDLCKLKISDYVKRLINYRWYQYMLGNYMPGDITCYEEIVRIIPNTYVRYERGKFKVDRFYPSRPISMCKTEQEYQAVINEASQVMKNTMALIPLKWEKPAISLTGGGG